MIGMLCDVKCSGALWLSLCGMLPVVLVGWCLVQSLKLLVVLCLLEIVELENRFSFGYLLLWAVLSWVIDLAGCCFLAGLWRIHHGV